MPPGPGRHVTEAAQDARELLSLGLQSWGMSDDPMLPQQPIS